MYLLLHSVAALVAETCHPSSSLCEGFSRKASTLSVRLSVRYNNLVITCSNAQLKSY